jgi:hypothetical protein
MRAFSHRWRIVTALALALVPTGMLGSPAASAATCENWSGAQPVSPGTTDNTLFSTTVLSRCDAWAVGFSISGGADQTLIEHWTGAAWQVVPSPDPGSSSNFLTAVRAVSPSNIWAVGNFSDGKANEALILHWNGHSWGQIESPNPGSNANDLTDLRAVSASNIWAVGSFNNGNADQTLILHWSGSGWKQVPSPHPGGASDLFGVTAEHGDAWAVGDFIGSRGQNNLILHWNGTRWKQVPSPDPGLSDTLEGVTGTSAGNAWAVGFMLKSTSDFNRTLILHWNGRKWLRVASPNLGGPGHDNFLSGIAATSAGNAWAVGTASGGSGSKTIILRWDGARWASVPSPDLGSGDNLNGVAASSPTDVWAVGAFSGPIPMAFAVHCC